MDILNGIDAARRRVEEQERTAERYTRMSSAAASRSDGYISQQNAPRAGNRNAEEAVPADETDRAAAPDEPAMPASTDDPVGQTVGRIAAALGTDTEKLLIIALIALLGSEGADMMLIAALAWLLI